jgi:hypothetical protein
MNKKTSVGTETTTSTSVIAISANAAFACLLIWETNILVQYLMSQKFKIDARMIGSVLLIILCALSSLAVSGEWIKGILKRLSLSANTPYSKLAPSDLFVLFLPLAFGVVAIGLTTVNFWHSVFAKTQKGDDK